MASAVGPAGATPNGSSHNGGKATATTTPNLTTTRAPLHLLSSYDDDHHRSATALFPDDYERGASDPETEDAASGVSSPASVTSPPPWWSQGQGRQARSLSNVSAESAVPVGGIIMRDNEAEGARDERGSGCWARSVQIRDYVVVNGSSTNIGAFVVWQIRVETLSGSHMNIRKRYSEFDELRRQLIATFPNFEAAVPALPPKSAIWKFQTKFLDKRRKGLQYFLNCIMLNPEFSGSPVLKDFLFG